MKRLDKLLRFWRTCVALGEVPKSAKRFFDIGCGDGYLLNIINKPDFFLIGCDPKLHHIDNKKIKFLHGYFPGAINLQNLASSIDVVFSIAVFEHFAMEDIRNSSLAIKKILNKNGLLIITVPHPFVDYILDFLKKINLISGQSLEEHHEFNPNDLIDSFSGNFILLKHKKFQFGLNNLYVFRKKHG
jgi:SAM-dependent methyltransferase